MELLTTNYYQGKIPSTISLHIYIYVINISQKLSSPYFSTTTYL